MSRYPDYLSPNTTPSKLSNSLKSRARREPSGVFSLFQASQIQQFKEAFQLIDHDKDGWVTESDLREIFSSLGISPSKSMLDGLLSARPGGPGHSKSPPVTLSRDSSVSSDRGINFTMFLTMMSERLFEFDLEAELREAFECFDEGDTGTVKSDEMQKWMGEVGERMGQQEVRFAPALTVRIDKFLKSSFTDRQGNFNYREWIKVIRVNDDGDEAGPDMI
ncbi:EF-hand [Suillus placidus]|uniref:EF-hand n=1 Tax=Suillus placidus TaxID=48579 RepID=A0A9P7A8P6_9AGAM|nr:EF-hand [Suillus placidus]